MKLTYSPKPEMMTNIVQHCKKPGMKQIRIYRETLFVRFSHIVYLFNQ